VPVGQPLVWLARGWRDLWRRPGLSLFYGLAVVAAGMLILLVIARFPYLFTAAISGFLLAAPMVATGLYELSRSYEFEQPVSLVDSMLAWRRNPSSMVGFGLFSLLAGTLWQVLSVIILALLYHGPAALPMDLIRDVLVDPQYLPLFMAYLGIGGLLAALVFAASVVSMPMLLDRCGDLLPAMAASIDAVAENPLPMALWASIIMVLTLVGFATGMLGLIIIMPWLGHASWHCYRDVVP
jgi:uncharacterized membrane protein